MVLDTQLECAPSPRIPKGGRRRPRHVCWPRVASDVSRTTSRKKNDDHCWRHSVQAVIAFKKFDVDHCRVHVQFRMPSRSSSKPLDATSPLPTRTCIMDVTKMATHPEGHRAEGCRCPLQSLELQRRTLVVPAFATLGG